MIKLLESIILIIIDKKLLIDKIYLIIIKINAKKLLKKQFI